MSSRAMSNQQDIQSAALVSESTRGHSGGAWLVVQWMVGAVLAFLIGSWLVWWGITLQRQFAEDEIKGACQRMIPGSVQRCVDTVTIQRGVARR